MSFDPNYIAQMARHRSSLSEDQRQLEAIEAIADNLRALHMEAQSIRILLESIQKSKGG